MMTARNPLNQAGQAPRRHLKRPLGHEVDLENEERQANTSNSNGLVEEEAAGEVKSKRVCN